jgi:DNA-binding transcriptional ArsR family regulator
MNSEWDDISFVISSRYRVAVLRRLADGPAMPSRIADDADQSIAHISRALQELRDRSLVELLVSEEQRKGRVYGITEQGSEVWERIVTENML